MTQQEAAALVKAMKSLYPKYFSGMSGSDVTDMVNTYASIYEDYELGTILAGLKAFAMTDTKGFPPVPGQIIDKIDKATNEDMTPNEAWTMVRKAIRNSSYHAEEEFEKFPETIKRAVGSAGNLRSWAQLPSEEVATVTQAQFIKSYNIALSREVENRKVPEKVRDVIRIGLNETPMIEGAV